MEKAGTALDVDDTVSILEVASAEATAELNGKDSFTFLRNTYFYKHSQEKNHGSRRFRRLWSS